MIDLERAKEHERWLIQQLQESTQEVNELIVKLKQVNDETSDSYTSLYADLIAKTLQVKLDAEDLLKTSDEISIHELKAEEVAV